MSKSIPYLGLLHQADGLLPEDSARIQALVQVFNKNRNRNRKLTTYYDAKVDVSRINIGIAIPDEIVRGLNVSCSWPEIAVASLQRRSQFDGFQHPIGEIKSEFDQIVKENRLVNNYRKAATEELKHGCVFATLTLGQNDRAQIRWHTAESAAARWDGVNDCIMDGMAIISTQKYNNDTSFKPSRVNIYTETDTIVLTSPDGTNWKADYHEHKMGRPLFGALIYKPSFSQPFGESRINRAVIAHTNSALRAMVRLEMGSELFTSPQKILLGASEKLAEQVRAQQHSMAMYLTNILALTKDEDDSVPDMKVLAAAAMTPHIDTLRQAACMFAAATSVPLNSLGIVQDNPSSAEALYAAKEDLVIQTTDFNMENGGSLADIALMAYAMNNDLSWDDIDTDHRNIDSHFLNPATPSVVSQADAYVKIASAFPEFSKSDVGMEFIGLTNEQIQRLKAAMDEQAADTILSELLTRVRAENGDSD